MMKVFARFALSLSLVFVLLAPRPCLADEDAGAAPEAGAAVEVPPPIEPPAVEPPKRVFEIPKIEGHITDPKGRVDRREREAIEALLDEIQKDTGIDVAAWIAPYQGEEVMPAGQQAYNTWHIGRDWTTGLLIVLSEDGQSVAFILSDFQRPALTPPQQMMMREAILARTRLGRLAEGLRIAVEQVGEISRADTKVYERRPSGTRNFRRGAGYGAGALAVVVLATLLTRWRRRAWETK